MNLYIKTYQKELSNSDLTKIIADVFEQNTMTTRAVMVFPKSFIVGNYSIEITATARRITAWVKTINGGTLVTSYRLITEQCFRRDLDYVQMTRIISNAFLLFNALELPIEYPKDVEENYYWTQFNKVTRGFATLVK